MVSAAQLQAQQQALRRTGVRVSLQVQQQALRRGVSPQQILIERERARVEAQVTGQLKSQAKIIEEETLSKVGSIEQFNELFKQIPPEIQKFIKLNPQTIKQNLSNRVSSLKGSINRKEQEIKNLDRGKEEALRQGNRSQADRFDSQRRGLQKEIDFIKGTIPRLEKGEIIETNKILSVAKDIGIAEEQKRKLTSEQVRDLTARLGTREEAREVLRTGKVTIEQAKKLGLELKEIRIPKEPDTLPAFRDPKTGEVIFVSFLPGEAEKRGLVEIRIDAKTLLPTKEFEKPTFDIFGFKTEPTEFEKSLGLDFSKLVPLPEEKIFFEKIKGFVPLIFDIPKPLGIDEGLISLSKIGVEKIIEFEEAKARDERIEFFEPFREKVIKIEEKIIRKKEKEFLEERKFIVDIVTGGSRFETRKEFDRRIFEERIGIFRPLIEVGGLGEPAFEILEKIGEKVPRKVPIAVIPGAEIDISGFLEAEVPFVSRQEAIELLDFIIKLGVFSKFFVTGTAAKQKVAKQKAKTKQVKKADKKTIRKLIDAAEDEFKKGTLKEKLASISDGIVRNPNLQQKNIQIQNMKSLLEELTKRRLIRNFFLDESTGALAFVDNTGLVVRSVAKLSPSLEIQIEAILFEAPKISKEALVVTGVAAKFIEGRIPPLDLGKIKGLEFGKIETLGELGKIPALDFGELKEQAKQQQKELDKLLKGILTIPKLTAKEKAEERAKQKQLEIPKFPIPIPIPVITIPDITFPDIVLDVPKPIPKFPTPKFPIPKFPTEPTKPKKPKIIPIPFIFPDKELRLIKLPEFEESFDVFVKFKGKKKKVNKVPLMENMAKDLGGWVVDNTLSAEFDIRKAKGMPKQPKIIVPNNYFNRNAFKFRNFMIKQGKIIPLKNKFIERKERRLDSPGEVSKITIARLLAQQRQQLNVGFSNSFINKKQKKQKFKQFDITKIINF